MTPPVLPLHITPFYAGLLGLLFATLSFNVIKQWARVTAKGNKTDQTLRRAERLLTSFAETAPFALLLLALLELNNAPHAILHLLGTMLIAGRLLHAWGSAPNADALRFIGTQLTYLTILTSSLSCIYVYLL